jgi:hypothetical protein
MRISLQAGRLVLQPLSFERELLFSFREELGTSPPLSRRLLGGDLAPKRGRKLDRASVCVLKFSTAVDYFNAPARRFGVQAAEPKC